MPEEALTDRVERWRDIGARVAFRGQEIHVHGRRAHGPLLVALHGFPSSSYDWREVLARLEGRATLVFDFLGFGLSDKPRDHVYSLSWQADLTEELVRQAAGSRPVFLVAHDMGTSVATELMARSLEGRLGIALVGALLFNGSILLDRASPTAGQRALRSPAGPLVARLSSRAFFTRQFASLFSPGHPLTAEEAADQWSLLAHRGGNRILHRLIHYMDERERLTERWHGAFRDWPGDLQLAWGLRDPVATPRVLHGLRRLRPSAPVTELPDLGHYPQVEDAAAIAELVDRMLG